MGEKIIRFSEKRDKLSARGRLRALKKMGPCPELPQDPLERRLLSSFRQISKHKKDMVLELAELSLQGERGLNAK